MQPNVSTWATLQERNFRAKLVSDVSQTSKDRHTLGATAATRTRGEVSAICDGLDVVSTPRGNDQPSPALTPSLFPECLQPTLHFPMPDENCECWVPHRG